MGATAHALGAATWETFAYDEDGNLLTPELLRLPRAARARHAAAQDRRDRVAVAVLGARHEGHGRGRRRRASTRSAPRCRTRSSAVGGAIIHDSHNPYHRVFSILQRPGGDAGRREGRERMNVEGTKEFEASRERVWAIISDPAGMAGLMPGVEGFEVDRRHALARQGQGAARPRRAQDDDGLRAARGAAARVRLDARQGQGHGRDDGHDHVVHAERRGRPHAHGVGGRRQARRRARLDGPARAAADRQPAGRGHHDRAREAARKARHDGSVPRRRDAADDGAAGGDARVGARHGRGRARHDLARRGLPVVAQARHGGQVLDGARRA